MKLTRLSAVSPAQKGGKHCVPSVTVQHTGSNLWPVVKSSGLMWWVSSGPPLPTPTVTDFRNIVPTFSLLLPSFATSTHSHLCKLSCSSSQAESYRIKSSLSFFQPVCCYWLHKTSVKRNSCSFSLCLSLSAPGGENPKQLKDQVRQSRKYSRRAHVGQQQGECMQEAKGKNPGKETT